jgi:hypothetical protein
MVMVHAVSLMIVFHTILRSESAPRYAHKVTYFRELTNI